MLSFYQMNNLLQEEKLRTQAVVETEDPAAWAARMKAQVQAVRGKKSPASVEPAAPDAAPAPAAAPSPVAKKAPAAPAAPAPAAAPKPVAKRPAPAPVAPAGEDDDLPLSPDADANDPRNLGHGRRRSRDFEKTSSADPKQKAIADLADKVGEFNQFALGSPESVRTMTSPTHVNSMTMMWAAKKYLEDELGMKNIPPFFALAQQPGGSGPYGQPNGGPYPEVVVSDLGDLWSLLRGGYQGYMSQERTREKHPKEQDFQQALWSHAIIKGQEGGFSVDPKRQPISEKAWEMARFLHDKEIVGKPMTLAQLAKTLGDKVEQHKGGEDTPPEGATPEIMAKWQAHQDAKKASRAEREAKINAGRKEVGMRGQIGYGTKRKGIDFEAVQHMIIVAKNKGFDFFKLKPGASIADPSTVVQVNPLPRSGDLMASGVPSAAGLTPKRGEGAVAQMSPAEKIAHIKKMIQDKEHIARRKAAASREFPTSQFGKGPAGPGGPLPKKEANEWMDLVCLIEHWGF